MTGSHSLSASNKFSRYRGSGQVTLAEIMELSGLMEGEREAKMERREEWETERGRAERMRELLTLRIVWAVGLVLLCEASFDSFDLNGGFSLG